jgi:hypothetical protein
MTLSPTRFCTVFGRGLPRDYIDVYAALASGAYTSADLVRLAADHDPGFDVAIFAQALQASRRYDDDKYTIYGLDEQAVESMRSTLLQWAEDLTHQAAGDEPPSDGAMIPSAE